MLWNFIEDPIHGTQVKVHSKRGKYILGKYLKIAQLGGHSGPCAVNVKSNKCAKSKTSDGNCVLSATGRCAKKSPSAKTSPVKSAPHSKTAPSPLATSISSVKIAGIPTLDVSRPIDPAVFTISTLYKTLRTTYSGDQLARELKKQFTNSLLDKITFNGTKYGDVGTYKAIFEAKLGKKWASKILNLKNTFKGPDIYRLGVPGRQGTVFKITVGGHDLAVKVTRRGTAAAPFLRQARFQQLAATHDITCAVLAVCCGGKKDYSFMVMDAFKSRVIDIYKGEVMSTKHQRQLFQLYYILDTEVGVRHNDSNCLNVMIDNSDNIRLIDFDRSILIHSIKRGDFFPNTQGLKALNCFKGFSIKAPEIYKIINEHFPYKHCTALDQIHTVAWNRLLPR